MVYRGGFWSICRNSPKINVMSAATSRPSADLQAGAQHTDSPPAAPAAEVLIVDNDQAHAETVAESLRRVGFRTHVATSGGEGARLVEEREFDAIITDLKMNDVDGLRILELAKSSQPDTEVILLTGFGSIPSAVEAMQKGASITLPSRWTWASFARPRNARSTAPGCGGRTSN